MSHLSRLRKIIAAAPELNQIPLFGKACGFDWHHFASELATSLGVSGLTIRAHEQEWKEATEVRKGMGRDLLSIPIVVSPIGPVIWTMSYEDIAKLTSWAVLPGTRIKTLSSESLQEGFYRYLLLQALNAAQEMQPFEGLSLRLSEEEVELEKAFCVDIEIKMAPRKSCWGRLVIPEAFHAGWVKHFAHLPEEYVATELTQSLPVTVGVQVGSVELTLDEWKKIHPGDFVILDHSYYHLKDGTGVAKLMLQSTPLFALKLNGKEMKIAGYATHDEDKMTKKHHDEEVKALKEIPLQITVELARLKMTLDELVHLAPGNQLELPEGAENEVSLVAGGEKVGSAELVYLGEKLGLRILEVR